MNLLIFLSYVAIAALTKLVTQRRMSTTKQYTTAVVILIQGVLIGLVTPDRFAVGVITIIAVIHGGDLVGGWLATGIDRLRLRASIKRARAYYGRETKT